MPDFGGQTRCIMGDAQMAKVASERASKANVRGRRGKRIRDFYPVFHLRFSSSPSRVCLTR